MDPLQNPYIKKSGYVREDADFIYYRDTMNKIRRIQKHNAQADKVIRLRFLEKPYFFWKRLQADQKGNVLAFSLFLTVPWVVYQTTVYWSERDQIVKLKARLPEQVTDKSYYEEFKKKRKEMNDAKEAEEKAARGN